MKVTGFTVKSIQDFVSMQPRSAGSPSQASHSGSGDGGEPAQTLPVAFRPERGPPAALTTYGVHCTVGEERTSPHG